MRAIVQAVKKKPAFCFAFVAAGRDNRRFFCFCFIIRRIVQRRFFSFLRAAAGAVRGG